MAKSPTVRGLSGKIKLTPEQKGGLERAKQILGFQERVIDNLEKAGQDVTVMKDKLKYTKAALSETEQFVE